MAGGVLKMSLHNSSRCFECGWQETQAALMLPLVRRRARREAREDDVSGPTRGLFAATNVIGGHMKITAGILL